LNGPIEQFQPLPSVSRMTARRIKMLKEAQAIIERVRNSKRTTQDEFFALCEVMTQIDNIKSDWEYDAYMRPHLAAIKRAERADEKRAATAPAFFRNAYTWLFRLPCSLPQMPSFI
jgi:hypothetical protein